MVKKKQDQRQYHKNLYEGRKSAGICTGCGKIPAKENRFQCEKCLAKSVRIQRKMLYGLSQESHERQVECQKSCAICGLLFDSSRSPYHDHDHECCAGQRSCGKCLRSLLCRQCNWNVGKVEAHLGQVLQYIVRWKKKHGRINSTFIQLLKVLE